MENREQQILAEIKTMMASIRSQLELLDAKMAELQQTVEPEDIEITPIDLEVDLEVDLDILEEPFEPASPEAAPEPVEQEIPLEDEPVEVPEITSEADEQVDMPEPADEIGDLPEDECGDMPAFDEPEPMAEPEPEAEPEPVLLAEPEPVAAAEIEPVYAAAQSEQPTTVNDALAEKQAWRTDMPGTAVRDIRSAISLNDRIIFINYLFNEDPMAFQEALTRINAMNTLDEAVGYVVSEHPEWNLESDFVYRFMMAVRRRIRQ